MAHEDVTALLVAWNTGDSAANNRLMSLVYDDLRRVARRRLRAERVDHSLAPTALVHETYMRLIDLRRVAWQNRAQFFAIAARQMRRSWWITRVPTRPTSVAAMFSKSRSQTTRQRRDRETWSCWTSMPRSTSSRCSIRG